MTFAEHLRNIRGDLTQTAFCRRMGIPLTTYQRYEKGERVPDIDLLAQIVRRVGISADTLLGLDHVSCPQGTAEQKDLIIAQQTETIANLTLTIKALS